MHKCNLDLHFLIKEDHVRPPTVLPMPIALGVQDITPVRDQFTFPNGRYAVWSVMAAVTGRIDFTLEPDAGPTTSGTCHAGSLILCPPEVVLHRHRPEPCRTWFAEFEPTAGIEPWWPSGLVSVSNRARLRGNYELLDHAERLRNPYRAMYQAHALLDILVLVGRESEPGTGPVDEAAARGATLLIEGLGDPELTIGAIAAAVHLSRTQFTRRFTQAYGVAPIRYLAELRISRARRRLLDTDLSVSAIAKECGYHSAFYFARVFRQFTDESPSGYRAARRI